MEDRLMSVKEVAEYLRLGPVAVYRMIAEGKLDAVRLNARCIRVSKSVLDAFIDGLTRRG